MDDKKSRFMELYTPVHEPFERFCKARACAHYAFRDLMQESILVAYSKFEQIREPEKLLYFLFGTATRLLANHQRTAAFRKTDVLEEVELAAHLVSQPPDAERREDHEKLYKALDLLPPEQRDALIYFEIVGCPVKEIAAFTNKSEAAVRQQLSRGRSRLLELLKDMKETQISKP
jgi:RNA polymerase sigma-70 factor (ECF subfamily)